MTEVQEESNNIIEKMITEVHRQADKAYFKLEEMFKSKDENEMTSELLLITAMAAHFAAIVAISNKLETQLEVLKTLGE